MEQLQHRPQYLGIDSDDDSEGLNTLSLYIRNRLNIDNDVVGTAVARISTLSNVSMMYPMEIEKDRDGKYQLVTKSNQCRVILIAQLMSKQREVLIEKYLPRFTITNDIINDNYSIPTNENGEETTPCNVILLAHLLFYSKSTTQFDSIKGAFTSVPSNDASKAQHANHINKCHIASILMKYSQTIKHIFKEQLLKSYQLMQTFADTCFKDPPIVNTLDDDDNGNSQVDVPIVNTVNNDDNDNSQVDVYNSWPKLSAKQCDILFNRKPVTRETKPVTQETKLVNQGDATLNKGEENKQPVEENKQRNKPQQQSTKKQQQQQQQQPIKKQQQQQQPIKKQQQQQYQQHDSEQYQQHDSEQYQQHEIVQQQQQQHEIVQWQQRNKGYTEGSSKQRDKKPQQQHINASSKQYTTLRTDGICHTDQLDITNKIITANFNKILDDITSISVEDFIEMVAYLDAVTFYKYHMKEYNHIIGSNSNTVIFLDEDNFMPQIIDLQNKLDILTGTNILLTWIKNTVLKAYSDITGQMEWGDANDIIKTESKLQRKILWQDFNDIMGLLYLKVQNFGTISEICGDDTMATARQNKATSLELKQTKIMDLLYIQYANKLAHFEIQIPYIYNNKAYCVEHCLYELICYLIIDKTTRTVQHQYRDTEFCKMIVKEQGMVTAKGSKTNIITDIVMDEWPHFDIFTEIFLKYIGKNKSPWAQVGVKVNMLINELKHDALTQPGESLRMPLFEFIESGENTKDIDAQILNICNGLFRFLDTVKQDTMYDQLVRDYVTNLPANELGNNGHGWGIDQLKWAMISVGYIFDEKEMVTSISATSIDIELSINDSPYKLELLIDGHFAIKPNVKNITQVKIDKSSHTNYYIISGLRHLILSNYGKVFGKIKEADTIHGLKRSYGIDHYYLNSIISYGILSQDNILSSVDGQLSDMDKIFVNLPKKYYKNVVALLDYSMAYYEQFEKDSMYYANMLKNMQLFRVKLIEGNDDKRPGPVQITPSFKHIKENIPVNRQLLTIELLRGNIDACLINKSIGVSLIDLEYRKYSKVDLSTSQLLKWYNDNFDVDNITNEQGQQNNDDRTIFDILKTKERCLIMLVTNGQLVKYINPLKDLSGDSNAYSVFIDKIPNISGNGTQTLYIGVFNRRQHDRQQPIPYHALPLRSMLQGEISIHEMLVYDDYVPLVMTQQSIVSTDF